jgi:hypothetical protein
VKPQTAKIDYEQSAISGIQMLEITDGTRAFSITKQQANDLELKLNVTAHGHTWKHIGDVLFDFSGSRPCVSTYTVNEQQYDFLSMLLTKNGYQECKGLK